MDQQPNDSAAQAAVLYLRPNEALPVMDPSAVVTVNGVVLGPSFFCYAASLTGGILVGADVAMHFAFEGVDVTRTLVMPSKPVPTASGTVPVSSPFTITWSAVSPVPDKIIVKVLLYTASGNPYDLELPGTAASGTIPAGTLLPNITSLPVIVEAVNAEQALDSYGLDLFSYQVGNQSEVVVDTVP